MCTHSPSVGVLPPRILRSVPVVLCGLGHCCAGPCGHLGPALGDVWFTWKRADLATTLVVLQSKDASALHPLVHAVNNCAHKHRIRVRTRGIDDRGHALAVVSASPQRPNITTNGATVRRRFYAGASS